MNASVSKAKKTDAPSTRATEARSNTISEAPGPTIFVPMPSNWKKLVCDGSIPVGLESNTKSTLEICPALAPCQRLLYANTFRISFNEQMVGKMKPKFSFMCALNLSNPALGQSLWRPICKPVQIIVFLPHRTSGLPQRAIRKEAFPPATCPGLSERDHKGSRSSCLTCMEGHGTIRNDNLFRHGNIEVTAHETHEKFAARTQSCSSINMNVHSLVRMQFLVQPNNPNYSTKRCRGLPGEL